MSELKESKESKDETLSWTVIDKMFSDNPTLLVNHHLDSYNTFFSTGIYQIFKENNPIRFIERTDNDTEDKKNECLLYLGGKDGNKIYVGKPVIYDDTHTHYMYPNDARLRNMTYGVTIHYDVDVEFNKTEGTTTWKQIYLGKFPIMLQSKLCILNGLPREIRFNMGECRNDYGGYFIIEGKEKVIISQEKFADNMLYIRKNKPDDIYSHSAEIRSVSEDSSKPIRTTSVKIVAPSPMYTNNQIVVVIPNVKRPVPLFILMRALGIISDKNIIIACLNNLEYNASYIDLFAPCVHDAGCIFNQLNALQYIAELTKRGSVSSVMEILSDYYLPHLGELNFIEKAYFTGHMVFKMLKVYKGIDKPTDRDNFKFKRVELSGSLIYDLFREYFILQKRTISLRMDEKYYPGKFKDTNFISLIEANYKHYFLERVVEMGFKRAFKGNWGATAHTKRVGVIQDINRLSWNTFISHLRKISLSIDASAKVSGPRLLHSTQWGYIDPLDTPDGGNIGTHKHMAMSAYITSNISSQPIIKWIRENAEIKSICESDSSDVKVFVNGNWIGMIENPLFNINSKDGKDKDKSYGFINYFKLCRRTGILPTYASISFDYANKEIYVYTDGGRLTRPLYFISNRAISYDRKNISVDDMNWTQMITGINKQQEQKQFNKVYSIAELYPMNDTSPQQVNKTLAACQSIIDYIDTSEEESCLIAMSRQSITSNHTHMEIHASLILGVMGNMIIYPEHNPCSRNLFSCGQSKQAVSIYNSNYQSRIDKMGVVLNYGQVPLIKSRYLQLINKEEMPYGVNAIVAIMSYTGYNVEDAILINKGSIDRGMFRTTYYSMYEAREENVSTGSDNNSKFANVPNHNVIKLKQGYDYTQLDVHGIIKEGSILNDKTILIGKLNSNSDMGNSDVWIDDSVKPKKGQLGVVDRSFITSGEEGFNIAKVRVREERIPAIGDKMASRSGQKGTIGLIIPEKDMPFTKDGIRPDLIINPHAIPSRMTIGQIVEMLFGTVCAEYGMYGDCTAFQVNGANTTTYASMLTNMGFSAYCNNIMYSGYTGEQLDAEIFMGVTYYMRLKHMVKDKINYRARGPNTMLERQPVQGRANDGGLRIGEMERDGVLGHGMMMFLNDSFMNRGDEYLLAICNKSGSIAIYNEAKNLFLSPYVDGPIQFAMDTDGSQSIKSMSKHGRSFSIVRIPYAAKLMIQELQAMNVQMRIITDDNIDHMLNTSYSNNIIKLVNRDLLEGAAEEDKQLKASIKDYANQIKEKLFNKESEMDMTIQQMLTMDEKQPNKQKQQHRQQQQQQQQQQYNKQTVPIQQPMPMQQTVPILKQQPIMQQQTLKQQPIMQQQTVQIPAILQQPDEKEQKEEENKEKLEERKQIVI